MRPLLSCPGSSSTNISPFPFLGDLVELVFGLLLIIPYAVVVVVAAGFVLGSLSEALSFLYRTLIEHGAFVPLILFFAGIAGAAYLTFYVMGVAKKQTEEKDKRKYKFLALYVGTLGILILLWYASYFARNWYPRIPYRLGGGRPLPVVFLLKTEEGHEKSPVIPDCGYKEERSIPYQMLLATEKTFVVLSPDEGEKAVEFERDAVLGVAVLEDMKTH